MNKQEKKLFRSLCSFRKKMSDESLLDYATPEVLGHLFFNRMSAVAYGKLYYSGLLGKVNREFRNSIKSAYEQNAVKNESFFVCIQELNSVLSEHKRKYAMLKGAFLCRYYPYGYRTSNDIDLLVLPEFVTEIGNTLSKNGFFQGYIRNERFVPAMRKEIIESKMMRGETVPYIKEVNLPGMKYLEVDINFSLDYKNGDSELIKDMLDRSVLEELSGLRVPTLSREDFFIHLCNHLYKEATTMPWVKMKRDMTLYKYCDIYYLLSELHDEQITGIFNRAKDLSMEKICAYAILQTAELLDLNQDYAVYMAKEILKDDPAFVHTVFSPGEKKMYVYISKNIAERFFENDRASLLMEVSNSAKTEHETK